MSDPGDRDFYIGYRGKAPAGVARFVRRWVLASVVFAAAVAAMLIWSQGRFAPAFFEFGNVRSFEGYVSEFPYPTLLVSRPEARDAEIPFSRYLLSVPGKRGAGQLMQGLDGQHVRLEGTLVYRDDQTMIEVLPASVAAGGGASRPKAARASAGRFVLAGEIVDSKCYLGVMNPGSGKPHRSCAVRCISGGIPPIFVARDTTGAAVHLLMIGEDDRTLNREVLDYVAEPLELSGEILREGGLLLLRTEPASFRRPGRDVSS